ncbi:atp2, beta subunit of the F1 sector of mitochondrial F1F0 ATP synthase, partial [Ascosphaera pollenicola]
VKGQCDVLNEAVYSYNQGVILSGLRGLWLATGNPAYLADGHHLVRSVMKATGWPDVHSQAWWGLGRGGVMEDSCDSEGTCSQDSQTFKGAFWHHFTEFCRPLYSATEERMMFALFPNVSVDAEAARALEGMRAAFLQHQRTCSSYFPWIKRNAHAAMATRDYEGKFGMWWGRRWPDSTRYGGHLSALSPESAESAEPAESAESAVRGGSLSSSKEIDEPVPFKTPIAVTPEQQTDSGSKPAEQVLSPESAESAEPAEGETSPSPVDEVNEPEPVPSQTPIAVTPAKPETNGASQPAKQEQQKQQEEEVSRQTPLRSAYHKHRNHRGGRKQQRQQRRLTRPHPHARPAYPLNAVANGTDTSLPLPQPLTPYDDDEDDLDKEAHIWQDTEAHQEGGEDVRYTDANDRGRGRTVETQAGGVAV